MSKAIRIAALGVPRFQHGRRLDTLGPDGKRQFETLEVGSNWTPFPEKPSPFLRETLRDFHGRFIQVHPEDRTALGDLGLAFADPHKPLVEVKAGEPKKTIKPDAGGKTDAKPEQGK